MHPSFIPLSNLPTYLDSRLWEICTLGILDQIHNSQAIQPIVENIRLWSDNFDELSTVIEYHGLSGLTHSLTKNYKIHMPRSAAMIAKANAAKHNQRWEAIKETLKLINKKGAQNIPFCLLKGSALATQIYLQPYQRAMSDIDIMCSPDNAHQLYQQFLKVGFNQTADHISKQKIFHHHLPPLWKNFGQYRIYIEIHTHALSFDLGTQIYWQEIHNQLRPITIDKQHYFTLSHEAMLEQLCAHAFARDQVIKLSNIVDIFRYAIIFENEINWQQLEQSASKTILTMRYARQLLKIPIAVLPHIKVINIEHNHGVGEGMMPLREFNNPNMNLWQRLNKLFFPSQWWQRIFYSVTPQQELKLLQRLFSKKSFWLIRYFIHPLQVISWILNKTLISKIKFLRNKAHS